MKSMITRSQFISEIKRIAAKYDGKPPGRGTFESETGFPRSNWEGIYWSKWSDALVEAGFVPNQPATKFQDEEIFEKLVPACRHFGRIPTVPEMRIYRRSTYPDFPISAIRKRFGADDLWSAFGIWLGNQEGKYEDISGLLSQALPDANVEQEVSYSDSSTVAGFVYLMKSGDHYKIGKSEDIERRVKEVRTQMPESLVLVHTIKTDDTSGIEQYWHKRFQNQRMNGEWFKLSRADVAAFKKRNFQ